MIPVVKHGTKPESPQPKYLPDRRSSFQQRVPYQQIRTWPVKKRYSSELPMVMRQYWPTLRRQRMTTIRSKAPSYHQRRKEGERKLKTLRENRALVSKFDAGAGGDYWYKIGDGGEGAICMNLLAQHSPPGPWRPSRCMICRLHKRTAISADLNFLGGNDKPVLLWLSFHLSV